MLVDLARNDLGRISDFGTLQVDELKTLERYSHVMHLTSQVSGRLARSLSQSTYLGRLSLPGLFPERPKFERCK